MPMDFQRICHLKYHMRLLGKPELKLSLDNLGMPSQVRTVPTGLFYQSLSYTRRRPTLFMYLGSVD